MKPVREIERHLERSEESFAALFLQVPLMCRVSNIAVKQ